MDLTSSFIYCNTYCVIYNNANPLFYTQIVQKTKTISVLSDSEDDTEIIKRDKKHSKGSKASEKKENGKQHQEISSDNIFEKKPLVRIEATKVKQKLQKVVNMYK